MTGKIEIAKLSGSGNDFICVSNMDGRYDGLLSSPARVGHFARTLCRHGLWIGADGVIFACPPEIEEKADLSARFIEADGSEAELCGNGVACFVRWSIESGFAPNRVPTDASGGELRVLTPAGVVRGRDVGENYFRACIPLPYDIQTDLPITVHGLPLLCDYAVVGTPHAVIYVDDIDAVDIGMLGPAIRHHPHFRPRGANANFVQVLGEGQLAVRTWEFGVEGETLACGTGSAAATVLAARRFHWPRRFTSNLDPVTVLAHSGDRLRIFLGEDDRGEITDLCLDTVVRPVFTGVLSDTLAAEAMPAAQLTDVTRRAEVP